MSSGFLKADGERFLPEFTGIIALEHYHRYFIALSLVDNKDVLDIASGEGFGAEILSRRAKSVTGVDISQEAVDHAQSKYLRDTIRFLAGSATEIPLDDDAVDVVVSFETIEHLSDHDQMMKEVKRVLRPGGRLIISSPNKLTYSDRANYTNPFHTRELYTQDFLTLTSRYFTQTRHYAQRVITGSLIAQNDAQAAFTTFDRSTASPGLPNQMYDIILASDGALPELNHSLFEEPNGALQPQRMEALQAKHWEMCAERALLASERDGLLEERASLASERDGLLNSTKVQEAYLDQLKTALWSALRDANIVVKDKWWLRTKVLRKWSNSLRKIKGKPKKTWPLDFKPESYLASAVVSLQEPRSTRPLGKDYDPNIPMVKYSDIREDFVPYSSSDRIETIPRAIAFYLPQFHPFKENDDWWGKGFTEWTNVGKAEPLFPGHHQPHCPIHLGYYDLRVAAVMEEQAALARAYGISGFAYYFYWFAGKVLMETPLQQMLANPKVDIPFCMIWANENWTRRWDGRDNDVLIGQKHSIEDSRAMLGYLRPFLDDPRYIKIDGKPLFVIYRADIIPDMEKTLEVWRAQAKSFGFPGLYIVCAQTFGHRDPRKYGFDAAMEFPPHTVRSEIIADEILGVEPTFSGSIYDYDQVVTNAVGDLHTQYEYKVFPTATLSWDNTARKNKNATIFARFSVNRYAQWLSSNAERVAKDVRLSSDEKLIFVNAWNEWAEGTHLEPDQKHGYGYLAATKAVMANYATSGARFLDPAYPKAARASFALIVHVHYEHTWPDIRDAITRVEDYHPDIYVTVTSLLLAEMINRDFPNAIVEIVDNRGRDIRPFLHVLKKIAALGYTAVCKVHGKASSYRSDGNELRRSAFEALLVKASIDRFEQDTKLGILVPDGSLIEHSEKNLTYSGTLTQAIAEELGLAQWRGSFPAGSMFWFRPDALAPLTQLGINDFDIERGLADGTRAHAIERLFCAVCKSKGYSVETTRIQRAQVQVALATDTTKEAEE